LEVKWPQWAGNTRKGAADTVVAITPHLVRRGAPDPPVSLHRWLADVGSLPTVAPVEKAGRELVWLERWSVPLAEITPGQLEAALSAATTRLDGKRMAPVVAKRRYNIVKSVFRAAVNRELIEVSPVSRLAWSPPRDTVVVDVATLPSVADVLEIVEELAVDEAYAHYAAFFASIGLAGLRPSEAAGLWVADLSLPGDGWGEARLRGALTTPGAKFTVDGKIEEEKGLKQRSENDSRVVPLPPVLVGWLRWHLGRFDRLESERVFLNSKGNTLSKDNWGKPWRDQRARRWPAGHKLAEATTYDLRHTAATMMLRAGVSAPEVALRLGHSVDMLMKVYAGVFEDERSRSNGLIDDLLPQRIGS
jgi:integrase